MTLGITVGKFLPLHRGHELLLREARARCDRLVVLVGDRPGQSIPGATIAGWIADEHDAEAIVVADDLPAEPGPWARRALEVLGGRRPDVAFTSEAYGEPWAAAMGARHVAIDVARERVPISATRIRDDVGACWSWLSAPAKAHLCRRVVVLGVESSGTTTLARALAEHLATAWVPEVGREVWEGRRFVDAPWSTDDLLRVARAQSAREDDLARVASRVLVCDTDALATSVWHRRYVGSCSTAIEAFAATRRVDQHLLTAPDFPFVQDGTREDGPHREAMHGWFREALAASGRPFVEVSGPHEQRVTAALAAIEPLLRFAPLSAGRSPA